MKSTRKSKIPSQSHIVLVPGLIYLFMLLKLMLPRWGIKFVPADLESTKFILSNFISAFGILYGVLLPLLLVRTLENFNRINQEFEIEANTTKILYEDFLILSTNIESIKGQLIEFVRKYALHVKENFQDEPDNLNNAKNIGDELLGNIRREYTEIVSNRSSESEAVISELLQRLAELENARVKRIESCREMFSGLGYQLALAFTASMFLIPFLVGFTLEFNLLEVLLTGSLTLIVVSLNIIIDDLNQPFNGTWKISNKSWQNILRR